MLGENFFSLVTNRSFRLKMNICILELLILFSKDLLFLCYIYVIGFWFFWEKSIFLIYFIVLFYSGYVSDFMMYHIWYTTHFFPKIERATFTNQYNLLIFFFRLKINFFCWFIKNEKCQKGLKYFARIKLYKKGKLKLGKI